MPGLNFNVYQGLLLLSESMRSVLPLHKLWHGNHLLMSTFFGTDKKKVFALLEIKNSPEILYKEARNI